MAVEPFRTSADAVAHAKELAKHAPTGAQIGVYGEDGKLMSEFFFQQQERPALDRDDTVPTMAASYPASRRT